MTKYGKHPNLSFEVLGSNMNRIYCKEISIGYISVRKTHKDIGIPYNVKLKTTDFKYSWGSI